MLSQDCVRELFDYAPETGIVTRKMSYLGRQPVGSIVGTARNDGYLMVQIGGTGYLLHRVIWVWVTGEMPPEDIDHVNLVRTDNRWVNLREASRSQNQANRRALRNNTSGFKGVSFHKRVGKYCAKMKVLGKNVHLGYTDTAAEAAVLYTQAATHHFGEFARS